MNGDLAFLEAVVYVMLAIALFANGANRYSAAIAVYALRLAELAHGNVFEVLCIVGLVALFALSASVKQPLDIAPNR